jgi:hypothetical protein
VLAGVAQLRGREHFVARVIPTARTAPEQRTHRRAEIAMRQLRVLSIIAAITLVAALTSIGGCSDSPAAPQTAADSALQDTLSQVQQQQAADSAASTPAYDSLRQVYDTLSTSVNPVKSDSAPPALLVCAPAQFASAAKIIGPAGGTLQVGKSTLTIPQGALSQSVVISAEVPPLLNSVVLLQPEGLSFDKPVTLTMDYRDCPAPAGTVHRVVYIDLTGQILQLLTSTDDYKNWLVSATTDHFSGYAVAY